MRSHWLCFLSFYSSSQKRTGLFELNLILFRFKLLFLFSLAIPLWMSSLAAPHADLHIHLISSRARSYTRRCSAPHSLDKRTEWKKNQITLCRPFWQYYRAYLDTVDMLLWCCSIIEPVWVEWQQVFNGSGSSNIQLTPSLSSMRQPLLFINTYTYPYHCSRCYVCYKQECQSALRARDVNRPHFTIPHKPRTYKVRGTENAYQQRGQTNEFCGWILF